MLIYFHGQNFQNYTTNIFRIYAIETDFCLEFVFVQMKTNLVNYNMMLSHGKITPLKTSTCTIKLLL